MMRRLIGKLNFVLHALLGNEFTVRQMLME
jgi:hypothetical protein